MLFNVGGVIVPLVAALVAVPILIANLGLARFGVLALMHAAIGYIGILDMGLGSALIYKLSPMVADKSNQSLANLWMRSSLVAVLILGSIAMIAVFIASSYVSEFMTGSHMDVIEETRWSVRFLALSIPGVLVTAVLSGILSAHQRFDEINKVRIPIGVLSYLGPALASIWVPNLYSAALILLTVRLAAATAHFYQCRRIVPDLWSGFPTVSVTALKPLIQFGSWLAVSNVVGPIMVYLDRFYIGAVLSVDHVSWYVTPYEVATKIQLVPAAVLPVIFPVLVANWSRSEAAAGRTGLAVAGLMAVVCAVPSVVLTVFAPQLLGAWLGPEFLGESVVVLHFLTAGVLINCVAQVFLVQIQAIGRTDVIAKFHVGELVGYLIALSFLTQWFGIVGVALAWTLRVFLDGWLLCWRACVDLPYVQKIEYWKIYLGSVVLALVLGSLAYVDSLAIRSLVLLVPLPFMWIFRTNLLRLSATYFSGKLR